MARGDGPRVTAPLTTLKRIEYGPRLRRLLAVIPWLAAKGSATFDEIAATFGLSQAEIEDDLLLAACCGLPPYTADRLIDLLVDDDGVTANVPDYFRRPPQLTAAEGFSLLATGRALLAVPGSEPDGPLARALDKLSNALGGPGVTIELDAPPFLGALRDAVSAHEKVEVDYYSAARDELTTRVIEPLVVRADAGHWYVAAYCHRAEDVLTFRVDRMEVLRPTGEHFEPRPAPDRPAGAPMAQFGPDVPTVKLSLPLSARWVVETYPVQEITELKTRIHVTVAATGEAWLHRLLLRVGPDVKVLAPASLRNAPAEAARRVLARY